ncbi:MAG: hypothetical protein COT73_00280 [Bdellovibrio sp. CG10_big_fil_rev_8_21_14_0_10_47_8]|nr:MAG: hypothetical protein COT73_00280 [Bdellovibrio sp. CG10_big_fil_rev_8_21_14_0_10_47_8]
MKSNLEKLSSLLSIPTLSRLASVGIFLLLCAKFYYLMGVTVGPTPAAPVGLVLVRDFITFGFLVFFGFWGLIHFPNKRLFWSLWFWGLFIGLLQYTLNKDLPTFAQHYFRNVLVPLLFYPVLLGLFRAGVKISIRPILIAIFTISVALSYLQIWKSATVDRPTGLFGDPIINTLILCWGLSSVVMLERKFLSIFCLALLVPLIQYMSSFSALIGFLLGGLTVLWQYRRHCYVYWKAHQKMLTIFIGTVVALVLLTNKVVEQIQPEASSVAENKFEQLYQSVFCQDAACQHRSYRGRIKSNLRPFELCSDDPLSCLIGNRKTAAYERIESTWASAVTNWGIIFCGLYFAWILTHLKLFRRLRLGNAQKLDKDILIWSLIFFSSIYFSFMNTLIYKFPINVLFYISMAYIHFHASNRNH